MADDRIPAISANDIEPIRTDTEASVEQDAGTITPPDSCEEVEMGWAWTRIMALAWLGRSASATASVATEMFLGLTQDAEPGDELPSVVTGQRSS